VIAYEADISTKQSSPREDAWVQGENEYEGREAGPQAPSRQGP